MEDLFDHLWNGVSPSDKLGGWPQWVQSVDYPPCPVCQRRRDALVVQLRANQTLDEGFGDVGGAYLLTCPDHPGELTLVTQSH